ncbi:MAG TPA: retropepsin-like aspartic protease [Gemmataceae bacterium]|jgi:predicted aspartyl protease
MRDLYLCATVAALLCATLGCSRAPTAGPASQEPSAVAGVEIALTKGADHMLVIEATIGGEPLLLLLDCGAATVAIDPVAAQRLNLTPGPADKRVVGLGAGGVVARSVRLPALALGTFTAEWVAAVVLDLGPVNASRARSRERPVDGVLGADFLEAHGAMIDYPNRRLVLR